MDEAVSPSTTRTAPRSASIASVAMTMAMTMTMTMAMTMAMTAGMAAAQPLNDPTRPPEAALPGAGGAPAGPQLQSVLVGRGPGGRRVAVIDGDTVRQGDTFRGARVARVGDAEVELVRGRERQVLRLYEPVPAAAAQPAQATHAAPAPATAQR